MSILNFDVSTFLEVIKFDCICIANYCIQLCLKLDNVWRIQTETCNKLNQKFLVSNLDHNNTAFP